MEIYFVKRFIIIHPRSSIITLLCQKITTFALEWLCDSKLEIHIRFKSKCKLKGSKCFFRPHFRVRVINIYNI